MGSQGFYVTTDVTCENNDIIFNAHVKGFTTTALASSCWTFHLAHNPLDDGQPMT